MMHCRAQALSRMDCASDLLAALVQPPASVPHPREIELPLVTKLLHYLGIQDALKCWECVQWDSTSCKTMISSQSA